MNISRGCAAAQLTGGMCFAIFILRRNHPGSCLLLTGEFHRFDIKFHQRELLHRQVEDGQGCILLGSHLGSFEVLRALGVTRAEYPLKV
jgi:predicted LPLAT superfamily acyltransferase